MYYFGIASSNFVVPNVRSTGVPQKLLDCMNEVYVRGCERAYLGPTLDKETICPQRDPAAETGAGSLVIHIRSGDIMKRDDIKGYYRDYGQVLTKSLQPFPCLERRKGLAERLGVGSQATPRV